MNTCLSEEQDEVDCLYSVTSVGVVTKQSNVLHITRY